MAEVGRVTIEPVVRDHEIRHSVTAMVNVGGSIVELQLDSEQDGELSSLVDALDTKLRSLALQTVRATFESEGG